MLNSSKRAEDRSKQKQDETVRKKRNVATIGFKSQHDVGIYVDGKLVLTCTPELLDPPLYAFNGGSTITIIGRDKDAHREFDKVTVPNGLDGPRLYTITARFVQVTFLYKGPITIINGQKSQAFSGKEDRVTLDCFINDTVKFQAEGETFDDFCVPDFQPGQTAEHHVVPIRM